MPIRLCKEKLIPGGLLEPVSGQSFLFFGESHKIGNFMVDSLECNGRRTRYLQRLVEFADKTGLIIRLIYCPPYHIKYNAIEHFWAGLEKSWKGYLLDETVLNEARLRRSAALK